MKYFFCFFIFLNVSVSSNSNFPFEIYRTAQIDYRGGVANDDIVMLYGDYGMIAFSEDKGDNWDTYYLGDSNDIKQMYYYQENFYGVSDYALFKSTNNGKNWQYKALNSNSFDFLVQGFAINNDKIYVPIKDGIRVFDLDFNELPLDFIEIENLLDGKIAINNQKLFCSIDSTQFMVYDIESNIRELIDFKEVTRCDTCRNFQKIEYIDARLIVNFSGRVYSAIDNFSSWNEVTKIKGLGYTYENGSFLNLEFRPTTFYKIENNQSLFIHTFRFKEINILGEEKTYDQQKNIFQIVDNHSLNGIIRLDELNILSFGERGLIAKSDNNGLDWEFVSLNPKRIAKSSLSNKDSVLVFGLDCVYLTTDNYLTIKPKTIYNGFPNFFVDDYYIDLNGKGISNLGGSVYRDERDDFYTTEDFGSNFERLDFINSGKGDKYIPFLNDTENVYFYINFFFGLEINRHQSIISRYNFNDKEFNNYEKFDSSHVVQTKVVANGDIYLLMNYMYNRKDRDFDDSIYYENMHYQILKSTDKGQTWDYNVFPNVEIDQAKHWLRSRYNYIFNDKFVVIHHEFLNFPDMNKFKEIKAFVWDLKTGTVDSVDITSNPNNFSLLELEGKYWGRFQSDPDLYSVNHLGYTENYKELISEENSFHINTILSRWKEGQEFDIEDVGEYQINHFYQDESKIPQLTISKSTKVSISQPNPWLPSTRFKERKTTTFLLRPKTPSSVENYETETPRSRAFLHAGKPYPLPAVSTVSADLHWNAQYSAQEAVLKVFDSMGNEIPNAQVELQQTNPYSGTVTWDCGTYPTGVYFIQVTIGTEQKNVGVAVVR